MELDQRAETPKKRRNTYYRYIPFSFIVATDWFCPIQWLFKRDWLVNFTLGLYFLSVMRFTISSYICQKVLFISFYLPFVFDSKIFDINYFCLSIHILAHSTANRQVYLHEVKRN